MCAKSLTRWGRLLVGVTIAAAAAAAGAQGAQEAQEKESAPRATVVQSLVDVGEVPVGEEIEAVFEIRNDGTAPLEITRVQPDCGCTVAEYDETIAPGQVGTIQATVETIDIVGPNTKVITAFTNDSISPRLRLTVESDVKPFLGLDPGYARFQSFVQHDRDQTVPQILAAPDFEDLEILAVESPQPWIEVEHREAEEHERLAEASGTQWRLDITLSADAPVGPVSERVLVRTNHPDQESISIPVSGFVRPMVAVLPPDVNFGTVDPTERQEVGVLVRNFGSSPLRIEDVHSGVTGIQVDIEPIQEGLQYKLVFSTTPELVEGSFDGVVEVFTNLPDQPTITVTVKGERI